MSNRAQDWLRQAERDLHHAKVSREAGDHEWACFAAHQTAEKACKALHFHLGQEAWGHVIIRLLGALPHDRPAPDELIEKARFLDTMYVPTRYPNGHSTGAPYEYYGTLQSEQAIQYASETVEFCRLQMA